MLGTNVYANVEAPMIVASELRMENSASVLPEIPLI